MVVKIVNEDVPVFDQQLYTQKVKEDIEIFTPLLSVKASTPGVDKVTGMYVYLYNIYIAQLSTRYKYYSIYIHTLFECVMQKSASYYRRNFVFLKSCPI